MRTSTAGSTNGWISINNTTRETRDQVRRAGWLAAPATFLAAFYVVPLLAVAAWALGIGAQHSAAETLGRLFTSAYYRERIVFTFAQAAASTVLTLLVGLPVSYVFATTRFPGKKFLRAAFTVPFVMPPLVIALALQAYVGRDSFFAHTFGASPLAAIGPIGAILVAHTLYNVSLIVRIVGASWERLPATLKDAAATLGATPRRIFWTVQLPIATPAILAASVLIFLFCASSFGIILLLGGPGVGTLETLIFDEVVSFRPHYDVAAALGVLQLFTTLTAVALYVVTARRASSTFTPTTTGPSRRPNPLQWAVLGLGTLLVVGPLVMLVLEAFRFQGTWSLTPTRLLFGETLPLGSYTIADAVTTSLTFAVLTAIFALPLAWASLAGFRRATRGQLIWNTLLLLPLGTSAVLIGLGYLLAFDGSPFPDLRAHPSRIVLAHILIAYPFTTRVLAPAFDALNPSLLQAARTLGARTHQLILRIELPLVRPALVAAGAFAFATSLGEFGATLVLRRPEYTTLPLALFDAYSRPGEGFRAQAEVIALLLALVALLSFWIMELSRKETGGDLL